MSNGSETLIRMYRAGLTKAEMSPLIRDMERSLFPDEFQCFFNKSDGTWNHAHACPSTVNAP